MTTLSDILKASLALMDAMDANTDESDYALRAPDILNALLAERRRLLLADDTGVRVRTLEDVVPEVSDDYAIAVLSCGLAAHLLLDENPYLSGYFLQRYQEQRNMHLGTAEAGEVEDVYGGLEFGEFGHW